MKLVVGLGNPGRKYEQTRHNVGFMAVTQLAKMVSAGPAKVRFDGEMAEGIAGGEKIVILCPQTYMNASGQSVRKAFDFYKLSTDDMIVVCDDLNLATGQLRIRRSGSAGGQKGLADIIRHLDSDAVPRLRIGIDRPPAGWEVTDYVLGKFSGQERPEIDLASMRAADAALLWAGSGITEAMNRFNATEPKRKKQANKKSTATKPPNTPNTSESN